MKFRVARPTRSIASMLRFYRDGLGFTAARVSVPRVSVARVSVPRVSVARVSVPRVSVPRP